MHADPRVIRRFYEIMRDSHRPGVEQRVLRALCRDVLSVPGVRETCGHIFWSQMVPESPRHAALNMARIARVLRAAPPHENGWGVFRISVTCPLEYSKANGFRCKATEMVLPGWNEAGKLAAQRLRGLPHEQGFYVSVQKVDPTS